MSTDYDTMKIEAALEVFDQTPHGIWWKDNDLRFRLINRTSAQTIGYKSSDISHDCVREQDLPCKAAELAKDFEAQDRYVIRTRKQLSMICFCRYSHGEWKVLMGHKFPRYNKDNMIIGMGGSSFDITHCSMMRTALLLISDDEKLIGLKMNSLSQFTYVLKDTYDEFNLTRRESECLFYKMRGKTSKEIGDILSIEKRTVDGYLDKVKMKMDCMTQSEYIEKALKCGAGNVIPKSIIDPQARQYYSQQSYRVDLITVSNHESIPKVFISHLVETINLVFVEDAGWYIYAHAPSGLLYRDYIENISDLHQLFKFLYNKKPSQLVEQDNEYIVGLVMGL